MVTSPWRRTSNESSEKSNSPRRTYRPPFTTLRVIIQQLSRKRSSGPITEKHADFGSVQAPGLEHSPKLAAYRQFAFFSEPLQPEAEAADRITDPVDGQPISADHHPGGIGHKRATKLDDASPQVIFPGPQSLFARFLFPPPQGV